MSETLLVKIREIYHKGDGYVIYICENLGEGEKYLWTTRIPNWDFIQEPIKGDIGYIKHKFVMAGSSTWFDPKTGELVPYIYTADYIEGFILKQDEKQDYIMA